MDDRHDHVDDLLAQWARERPALDVGGLAITARIIRLQRYLDHRTRSVVAAHGLTIGETNVLAALRRAGPPHTLTPTELYRSLLLSSAAMTHRVDRLEELGYVTRSRAEHDRRQVEVALTGTGLEAVDRVMDDYTAQLSQMLAALDDPRRTELEGALRALLLTLEDTDAPPTQS
ncbi:MAG: MarR family winged helix-turn-helix transcriptional regulator [Nitriliruptoraceae bacterium]